MSRSATNRVSSFEAGRFCSPREAGKRADVHQLPRREQSEATQRGLCCVRVCRG